MASVTFSPSVGGDGSTVTDDSNPTTGLANGGHRTRFVPSLSQTVAVAANTVTKATEALNSSTTAANYATKTDGFASGSDNSAKSWAVGGTGSGAPTAGNSKDWATKTSGNVDGTEFSSKEYAVGTNIRGVAGKGSAKDWATYTGGTVDGTEYSAKKYAQDAAVLFDQFDDKYLGAKASDPSLDNDGNPLQAGATYINTTTNLVRFYTGSSWQNGVSAVAGVSTVNGLSGDVVLKTINSTSLTGSGDIVVVTLTGSENLSNKTLTAPTITGYTETVYALSGTDINPANGTVQTKTLGSNTTLTESIADGQSVVLMLNPVTYTTTFPTITWVTATGTGTAPMLKASAYNVITMWQVSGTLYGLYNGAV